MNNLRPILFTSLLFISSALLLHISNSCRPNKNKTNKAELTYIEKQATHNAVDRFKTNDPELRKTYQIEFIIANYTMTLDSIELFLNENRINFHDLNINGTDLYVVIEMKMEKEKIIEIESYLTYFANEHNCKYDGWEHLNSIKRTQNDPLPLPIWKYNNISRPFS